MSSSDESWLYCAELGYAVTPRNKSTPPEEILKRMHYRKKMFGKFSEYLLLNDRIHIDVTAANLELIVLYEWLGKRNLLKLLDEDVIRFVYCPGTVAYISKANLSIFQTITEPGLYRIAGTDPAWQDPEASVRIALDEQTSLTDLDKKEITRYSVRNYVDPGDAQEIFKKAIQYTDKDKSSSAGEVVGLSKQDTVDVFDVDEHKRRAYLDLASLNRKLICASLTNCSDIVDKSYVADILFRKIVPVSFFNKGRVLNNILEFEEVLDVATLVQNGHLAMNDILEIRGRKNTLKFRKWINKVKDSRDKVEIIREYNRAVGDKLTDRKYFKSIRIAALTTIGELLGSAVGHIGVLGGPVVGLALNYLLGITDNFWMDRFINGWNPKLFIDEEIKRKI